MLKKQSIAPDFTLHQSLGLTVQTDMDGQQVEINNFYWAPLFNGGIPHPVVVGTQRPILLVDEGDLRLSTVGFAKDLRRYLAGALAEINADQVRRLVIVYRPSWAAEYHLPADAQRIRIAHRLIRDALAAIYDLATAGQVPIFYGGFYFEDELPLILGDGNVDGVLVNE